MTRGHKYLWFSVKQLDVTEYNEEEKEEDGGEEEEQSLKLVLGQP